MESRSVSLVVTINPGPNRADNETARSNIGVCGVEKAFGLNVLLT